MSDEKKVVDLAVEPTPQIDRTPEVVETQAVEPQPTETPVSETQTQVPTVPPVKEDVDEFGVPWKNRAMEWRRKSEELADKLPQMIEEKLSKVNQPSTPKYTYEQLEAYKLQNSADPSVVAWAAGEQRKMMAEENRKLFEEVVGGREQKARVENQKQQALNYVQTTYPDAFAKDAQGRPVAWNENSPMTQQIRQLMQRPDLMNHPEGLAAAADIAYGRLARMQTPVLEKKAEALKAEVKQAQKASLTEGAGRRVTISETPVQSNVDRLKKSGSLRDAETAMGSILRQKGIIGE